MKKTMIALALLFGSLSGIAQANSGRALYCELREGSFPVNAGWVERLGVGRTRINGVVYNGYTVLFTPSVDANQVFAKVWGPGWNPRDAFGNSAVLICQY